MHALAHALGPWGGLWVGGGSGVFPGGGTGNNCKAELDLGKFRSYPGSAILMPVMEVLAKFILYALGIP